MIKKIKKIKDNKAIRYYILQCQLTLLIAMLQLQTMKLISMHNKHKMLQIRRRKKLKLKHLQLRKKSKLRLLPQKKKNKQPLRLRKNMLPITSITAEQVSSMMVMMNTKVRDCKKFHKLGKITDKRITMSNSKNKNKHQLKT